jgi:Uma2 family endonuclease
MATKTRVSLEEFLAMPETEPASELIDGEVIQKMAPSLYHGILTLELGGLLRSYLHESREGHVVSEVRHRDSAEQRVFVPDINVTLKGRLPKSRSVGLHGPIDVQPDFAIEVISPGDSVGQVMEKADFYMRAGTGLLWLVDPELESITAYRPGGAPTTHRAPGVIDAKPVLSSFEIDLAALFAVLHEHEYE